MREAKRSGAQAGHRGRGWALACRVGAIAAITLLQGAVAPASIGDLEMITLRVDGTFAANGSSNDADVSADGRLVVFESAATDLLDHDMNDARDVYIWDRDTGTVGLLLENFMSTVYQWPDSSEPTISDNGEFVVFNNNSIDGTLQTYIYERATGALELASAIDRTMLPGNDEACGRPDVSNDGNIVLFCSRSNDLVEDDENNTNGPMPRQMFIRVRSVERTFRLTDPVFPKVESPNGDSWDASMDAEGARVAFVSDATNLPFADGDGSYDIFIWDVATQTMVDALTEVDLDEGFPSGNAQAEISGDGSVIAFTTPVALVAADTDTKRDIYVYERGVFEFVSPTLNAAASYPALSADGQKVVFAGLGFWVWMYDRATGIQTVQSVNPDPLCRTALRPQISGDGSTIVFESSAEFFPDLDSPFGNSDIFVCTEPSTETDCEFTEPILNFPTGSFEGP